MFEFLTLEQAEVYVLSEQRAGRDAFWNGWEIVTWKPNIRGILRADGSFRNGKWGTSRHIKCNRYGKYRIST